MKKIELIENQRVESSAYIFMAFEKEMQKKDTKITEEDYQDTLCGSIDADADAMYIVLKKHNITEELDGQLTSIKALEYFKNLKKVIK